MRLAAQTSNYHNMPISLACIAQLLYFQIVVSSMLCQLTRPTINSPCLPVSVQLLSDLSVTIQAFIEKEPDYRLRAFALPEAVIFCLNTINSLCLNFHVCSKFGVCTVGPKKRLLDNLTQGSVNMQPQPAVYNGIIIKGENAVWRCLCSCQKHKTT